MVELSGTILVPNRLSARADGRKLLESYGRYFPDYGLEWFGEFEPLNMRFDPEDLEAALGSWGHSSFTAERGDPDVLLDVRFARPSKKPYHSGISLIRFQALGEDGVSAFEDFVCETATVFEADLAVAHILTQIELRERVDDLRSRKGNVKLMKERVETMGFARVLWDMTILQFVTRKIEHGLPDLFWLTVFGSPYVSIFGRDRLLRTPAHEVRELPNGSVKVKLTDRLYDDEASWKQFQKVRDRCKAHLNSGAFRDQSTGPHGVSEAPHFEFPREINLASRARGR